jgi:uncharacterized protein YjbI with pentapeptide repeats
MDASELQAVAAALTAIGGVLVGFGVPKYFQYRSVRDSKVLVRDAFGSVVKSLASTVEVERLAAGILMRRFFDSKSEVGMSKASFANEVVNVIAAVLRGQETGTFQKILVDSLKYAPSLEHTDLQRTNLQKGYLGSDSLDPSHRINLSHSDFYRSNLSGGSLKGAKAQKAQFYQAHLQDTVLDKADLQGANFFEADLQGARFVEANLEGANFRGAFLKGANFRGSLHLLPSLAARLDQNGVYNESGPFMPSPDTGECQISVFLSKPGLPDYRRGQLVRSVRNRLDVEGMAVKVLERSEYAPGFGSLAEVKRRISECAGAVLLGFRDIAIKDGLWREGTSEQASLEGLLSLYRVDAHRGRNGHHGWTASAARLGIANSGRRVRSVGQ